MKILRNIGIVVSYFVFGAVLFIALIDWGIKEKIAE